MRLTPRSAQVANLALGLGLRLVGSWEVLEHEGTGNEEDFPVSISSSFRSEPRARATADVRQDFILVPDDLEKMTETIYPYARLVLAILG